MSRCQIIAEIGCNHLGDLEVARQMIHAAKDAGADAVKFQVFRAEELYAPENPAFTPLKREELAFADFEMLFHECKQAGIEYLATPFDPACADFLESLGVSRFKIGSGELTYHTFLAHLAQKGRPLILSTGMSDWSQVEAAVAVIQKTGPTPLSLLHCVSAYPAPLDQANLQTMLELRERFHLPIGYSDHSIEPYGSYAAVALGATLVEKHFTLSRQLPGDDHHMSLEPKELSELVRGIRGVEAALGTQRHGIFSCEQSIVALSRRALYARREIDQGEIFGLENIVVRRPCHEVGAEAFGEFAGRQSARTIPAGTPLRRSFLSTCCGEEEQCQP
jgi:N-acetylneuraminate synthase/N,N'-diacetyllegionaminate synthase